MTNYIAPYILKSEYICRCPCKRLPPSFPKDFSILDKNNPFLRLFTFWVILRKEWNKEIKITSGYRCVKYNKQIGGAPISAHIFGVALDLLFNSEEEVKDFKNLIEEKAPELRMGEYTRQPGLIHIDTAYLIYPKAHNAWVKGKRFKQ